MTTKKLKITKEKISENRSDYSTSTAAKPSITVSSKLKISILQPDYMTEDIRFQSEEFLFFISEYNNDTEKLSKINSSQSRIIKLRELEKKLEYKKRKNKPLEAANYYIQGFDPFMIALILQIDVILIYDSILDGLELITNN